MPNHSAQGKLKEKNKFDTSDMLTSALSLPLTCLLLRNPEKLEEAKTIFKNLLFQFGFK